MRMRHVLAPPPLILVLAFFAGVALDTVLPLRLLPPGWEWIAWVLFILGAALTGWAAYSLWKAKTPISPYEKSTHLVTGGAYRYSRNPIYVGLGLIFLALAVYRDSLWLVLLCGIAFLLIHFGVVRVEERHLEEAFGKNYRKYRQRTRRWL